MADLRERFRSYDSLAMPAEMWADAERRAVTGPDGTTERVPWNVAFRWVGPERRTPGTTTRIAIALLVLALVLAAAFAAIVAGLPRPDRRLGVVPQASHRTSIYIPGPSDSSPASTPTPTWSVDVESFVPDMPEPVMPDLGPRFESTAYPYSIQAPDTWSVLPAARPWSGDGTWTRDMADVFLGPGGWDRHRLTIVAAPVASDVDQQAWIDAHVPPPAEHEGSSTHEHCVFSGGGGTTVMEEGLFPWRHVTYDGRLAWLRRGCGHANVVIFMHQRALVLDFFTWKHPVVEVDQQRVFLETIDLDPLAAPQSGRVERAFAIVG